MSGKTVTAIFNGKRVCRIDPTNALTQYDYGRVLLMPGLDLPDAYEVFFSKSVHVGAIKMIGDENGVKIPDELLLDDGTIYAWVFLHDGEDSGETEYTVIIPVKARSEDSGAEPTPVQQDEITEAIAALQEGVGKVEDIAEAIPQTIDDALAAAKASGEFDGPPGEDGVSPTATVTQTEDGAVVAVTDREGTTTAELTNGKDGENGVGVPEGGTVGQVLAKKSGEDYDTEWTDAATGGVSDVQVNGTSVVSGGGVANVPVATTSDYGVVKMGVKQSGIELNSNNNALQISPATDTAIKNGNDNFRPIVPGKQNASVFYGLAKAAGDSTQSASENAVGTYTDEAKDKIQQMLGVTPLIAPHETDPFTAAHAVGELFVVNGKLYRATASIEIGDALTVGTNVEQLNVADELSQLSTAISAKADPVTVTTVSGSTPSITAQDNHRYVCGECATLDITVPASGIIDVVFESGSTPTVLTVTPPSGMTMRWANGFDPTSLEANTTYEINVMNGNLGVAGTWT